jgi:hypothetical protein
MICVHETINEYQTYCSKKQEAGRPETRNVDEEKTADFIHQWYSMSVSPIEMVQCTIGDNGKQYCTQEPEDVSPPSYQRGIYYRKQEAGTGV